jgi:23S rRNA (uracil1939-C5)-methyltransferase
VTLVESFAPAADAARRQGLRAVTADAASYLGALARDAPAPDAIVINPPRRGVSPAVRSAIGRLAPRAVAYVSCAPDTLARDLAHLSLLGFSAKRLVPLDMIPLSDQVETLALLGRAPAPAPRILHEQDDLLAVDKPAHEPVHADETDQTGLLARVRRLSGWSDAVALVSLDRDTSGICLFARTPTAATRWQSDLSTAEQRFIALVRGITRDKGVVNRPIGDSGRVLMARTRYKRVSVLSGHSLLELVPFDAKRRQIRRHLAGIGHPVVGDEGFGNAPTNRHFAEKHGLDRCFLHLARVDVPSTRTGNSLEIEAALPGDLDGVKRRLSRRVC